MAIRGCAVARILVIDDSDTVRDLLGGLLEDAGYEVRAACDGREGLLVHRKELFDLVITDVQMPGKSGSDVIKQIRSSCRGARIIAMSDYGGELVSRIVKCGADHVLLKPFRMQTLLTAVDRLLCGGDGQAGDVDGSESGSRAPHRWRGFHADCDPATLARPRPRRQGRVRGRPMAATPLRATPFAPLQPPSRASGIHLRGRGEISAVLFEVMVLRSGCGSRDPTIEV